MTCPACGRPLDPTQPQGETSPRGQTFYAHPAGRWCVLGVVEETR